MFKIGEIEIFNLLKHETEFKTAKEIAQKTKLSLVSVHKSLKQMRRFYPKIEAKKIRKRCGKYNYRKPVFVYKLKR